MATSFVFIKYNKNVFFIADVFPVFLTDCFYASSYLLRRVSASIKNFFTSRHSECVNIKRLETFVDCAECLEIRRRQVAYKLQEWVCTAKENVEK